MPLPLEAIAIHGGCNCGAIRYCISVPEVSARPIHFSFPPDTAADPNTPRMPLICTDHCNDCRSATAAIVSAWILTPEAMFTMSCLPMDESESTSSFQKRTLAARDTDTLDSRPPYVAAHELLRGDSKGHGTWLRLYASTDDPDKEAIKRVIRSFCGRCGTNLTYVVHPMPFGFSDMIDVILGTVDREDLANEWMRPTHQLWWSYGIPWIKEMMKGLPATKHPTYSPADAIPEE